MPPPSPRTGSGCSGTGWAKLCSAMVLEADRQGLLSDEHFTVDGTLIEAAASLKSFKPKDGDPPRTTDADPGNPSVDFHGERRGNATHQSTTDPEARLLRKGKGKEARLVFMAHALMENRHGMLVDFQTTQATGTAERDIVPELLGQARGRGFHPQTLGGDKGYDTRDCVADLRRRGVTPHVAQNTKGRSSAIDGRTTRHPGYAVSQIRKRVEEIFGWMKTVGGFRRTRRLDNRREWFGIGSPTDARQPVPQKGRSAKPKGLKVPCERHSPPTGRLQRLEPDSGREPPYSAAC